MTRSLPWVRLERDFHSEAAILEICDKVLRYCTAERSCGFTSKRSGSRASRSVRETLGEVMVGATGFEPATSCPPGKRATKLRYAPFDL